MSGWGDHDHPEAVEPRGGSPVIIVGVDGSIGARAALCFAISEARLRRTALTAICAHERPWSAGVTSPYGGVVVANLRHRLAEEARAMLREEVREALEATGDGVRVLQEVVEGPAAAALVKAAESAELLVVGSRGRGGVASLLLGSVSRACAQHAPCPVVIVPAAAATLVADAQRLAHAPGADRDTAVEWAVAEAAHLNAAEGGYHSEREYVERPTEGGRQ
jgi:nucleotide-binding universal stress UspA family protein